MRNQDSRAVIGVSLDGFCNPVLLSENFWEKRLLAVAEFEHQPPAGFQEITGFECQAAVKIQSVRTAIQGDARVVVAHLRFEGVNFGGGNVGRVGYNQVKAYAGGQGRKAVAGEELEPGLN